MQRFPIRMPGMLLLTTLALPAQNWTEVGDAGSVPKLAQVPVPTVSPLAPLSRIDGTLTPGDVDMYLIDIDQPGWFQASTVGGAAFDTQLWLFHTDGRGVVMNDDAASLQSLITGAFVPFPGWYYLAISAFDVHAIASSMPIWSPGIGELPPNGPRRFEPVDGWDGPAYYSGTYSIALVGTVYPARQVVLPDNHYLGDSAAQTGSIGSTAWWWTGGGRFQVLYERGHFVGAGVNAPILIEKLLFRGEDGEPNRGGQLWNNVALRIGTTPLTAATMTTNFAANLAASTMTGPFNFAQVVVAPSLGATPNNYNIVLDLTVFGGWGYNPLAGNVLIDVTLPSPAVLPPSVGPVMEMQIATGDLAFVRGRGLTTPLPIGATGFFDSPPVIGVKFDGPGGYAPAVPARNAHYGAACGGRPSTFYEGFLTGQPLDLLGLTLTPDDPSAPHFYLVTQGAAPFDATWLNPMPDSTLDDAVVPYTLGFPFRYPGGSTTTIAATTNGYVWLDAAVTNADPRPTVDALLTGPARFLPCWYDFHAGRNVATHANSGLHVRTDTSGGPGHAVCYVTWYHVGIFDSVEGAGIGGHAVHDLQLAIHEATGVVEFRYGALPTHASNYGELDPSYAALVGFTRGLIGGTPSVDPLSRDLSVETPFTTSSEGPRGNMAQLARATPVAGGVAYGGRMFPGQTLTFDARNVPAGALIGVQLLDVAPARPGIVLPGITASGCKLSTTPNALLYEVRLMPPSYVAGTLPLFVPPGFSGTELFAQYVVLDGLFGGPDLITVASDAIALWVGLN